MEIRKSSLDDVKDIMTLIHQAQSYFKKAGIDQWQDGYPQADDIIQDINQGKSYVIEDTKIIGTMYFAIEDEPTYHIIDGHELQRICQRRKRCFQTSCQNKAAQMSSTAA